MPAPHLLHAFPTFIPAGAESRTVGLINAFGPEFRHSVVVMDGRMDAKAHLSGSAEVRFPPTPKKAGTLVTLPRMRALLAREAPDLVLTYNFGAFDTLLAARSLRLPVIHHEDGFHPDEAGGFKRRRVWLRRAFLPGTFRVVVISELLKKIALELWRLDPRKLEFIPNGIEAEGFPARDGNTELRLELGIPATAIVVGAVGHMRPEKNVPRLLAAVARLVPGLEIHVVVLGDGGERERIAALAAKPPLAGRVHLVGYQKDPRPYYRAMDIFALTSDTEQMPIALLEAMACSLPVVATNVGDVRAMLPGEQAAFLVLPGGEPCVEALATGLGHLARDPELLTRLGAKNQGRVRAFYSKEGMVRAYRRLYLAALAGAAAARA
jgi:glycosyltransferase involved in cell wall biosynthesis